MNLQQLHHLVALHDTGSFSRAAEQLHLTQPALSRSIKQLEQELGLALLDRVGKRNSFTAFGDAVLARARRIVFESAELKRSAQLLQEGQGGALHVGMAPGPAALLMHGTLKRFASTYPAIRLHIAQGATAALVEQLGDKALDAVVADARAIPPSEELALEHLTDMPAGCLCRAGHPLLSLRSVGIEDLARYPVAAPPLSSEIARIFVERHGAAAHPQRLVTLRCDSVSTLVQVALQTDAVYVGIYAAALEPLMQRKLRILAVQPSMEASARYSIVALAGRTPPPALGLLRSMLAQETAGILGKLAGLPGSPRQRRDKAAKKKA